jgi:glycosyltransferase involved in cell wall biosynthesis
MVPRSIKKARRVLVPSDFTRDEILEVYQPMPEKIVVTPCGVLTHFQPIKDPTALQEIRRKYGIENDFILAVGNIQPRKNLVGLIRAYAILKSQGLDSMPLVVVGKSRWQVGEVYQAVQSNNLEKQIIFTGYIPEQDLLLLYNAAKVFVYPSFYEGFGLPVVEAMTCGTPVITSNRASLPWVAGEATLLIDPDRPNEIAEALAKVLADENLAKEMSRKGLEQAARFSWENTAALTLAAYQVAATIPDPDR